MAHMQSTRTPAHAQDAAAHDAVGTTSRASIIPAESLEKTADPIFAVLADFLEKKRAHEERQQAEGCDCRDIPSPEDAEAFDIYTSWIGAYARLVRTSPTSFLGARDLLDWGIDELEHNPALDRGETFWAAFYLVRHFLEQQIAEEDRPDPEYAI
ncbi:MAG: hypothetical protein GVY13_14900 [Alphaproteobacteria bacterium]|jgi:hypothetical protein|nr:hypothetical protein [Alphaproteobacteria bacterium]